jgi:hypothetical protein
MRVNNYLFMVKRLTRQHLLLKAQQETFFSF